MLFRRDILQGIAEGRVTLAFRRWRRLPARARSCVSSSGSLATIRASPFGNACRSKAELEALRAE